MSFLTHIPRFEDFNYNEDFEESIARTGGDSNSEDEEGEFSFQFSLVFTRFLQLFFIILHFFRC
jgi:hypothetical protein